MDDILGSEVDSDALVGAVFILDHRHDNISLEHLDVILQGRLELPRLGSFEAGEVAGQIPVHSHLTMEKPARVRRLRLDTFAVAAERASDVHFGFYDLALAPGGPPSISSLSMMKGK